MEIVGIDYSLTSPCLCVCKGNFAYAHCKFHYLTDQKSKMGSVTPKILGHQYPSFNNDEERYDKISQWAYDIISELSSPIVCIEGYAFNATGQVFNIAENCGLLKHKLFKNGIPFNMITPTVVKKFATGRGNASKQDMYDSFLVETDHDILSIISSKSKNIGNPVSDIVDAYFIASYQAQHLPVVS